jgi:hypothetical protein
MWLADGAFGGLVKQMMVLAQDSLRLQPPRVMERVEDVGDQAFEGSLAARRNVQGSSLESCLGRNLGRNFRRNRWRVSHSLKLRSFDGAHHG